jgi:hypothetical protein
VLATAFDRPPPLDLKEGRRYLETCVTEAIQAGGGNAKIAELIDALRFNGSLTDFSERAAPLASSPIDDGESDLKGGLSSESSGKRLRKP